MGPKLELVVWMSVLRKAENDLIMKKRFSVEASKLSVGLENVLVEVHCRLKAVICKEKRGKTVK